MYINVLQTTEDVCFLIEDDVLLAEYADDLGLQLGKSLQFGQRGVLAL